jgi:hypothetical protein
VKPRTRFEIVVVFQSGGCLKIASPKDRALSGRELVAKLRKNADMIERGLNVEDAARCAIARAAAPEGKETR